MRVQQKTKNRKKSAPYNAATCSVIDEKHFGQEPRLSSNPSLSDIIGAYNWYSYFHTSDDAKKFTLDFLRDNKEHKLLKKVSQLDAVDLHNIGWNCRILSNGGVLPDEITSSIHSKLNVLINKPTRQKDTSIVVDDVVLSSNVPIQERIKNKKSQLIAELETELDKFYSDHNHTFDAKSWFSVQNIKPQIASFIHDFYSDLYSEIYDALHNKDDKELKYAYKRWSKTNLKKYLDFVKNIVSTAGSIVDAPKTKPVLKKKEKPASALIKKIKFKDKNTEYNIESCKAVDVIGAEQLWLFNTKTKLLSVYNALGPNGLSIKSIKITGYDEKTSTSKTLRNSRDTIRRVLDEGKLGLRKIMNSVNTKDKPVSARINDAENLIILRVIKK